MSLNRLEQTFITKSLKQKQLACSNKACIFRFSKKLLVTGWWIMFFHPGLAQETTFTNPIRDGADPWVYQKDKRKGSFWSL